MANEELRAAYEAETGETLSDYEASYLGDSDEIEMAKHESVYAVENPETGRKAYPATTPDGYPVLANGSVEGCGCERCEDRRDLGMETDDAQPTGSAVYCLGAEVCGRCGDRVEVWTTERGDYTVRVSPGTNGDEHSC